MSQESSYGFRWQMQEYSSEKLIPEIGRKTLLQRFTTWLHLVASTWHRELIVKRGSVKMWVYDKKCFSNTNFWMLNFFARNGRKQMIFQKHYINGTTQNNNLHILYQKAIKFNICEMMNLTKIFDSIQHNFL